MGESLRPAAKRAVSNAFAYYGELLVTGYYFRAGSNLATVHWLVMPVPARRVDGQTVLPNDERVLLDASELAAVDQPRPGDYLIDAATSLRRDVITAHLDVTQTFWTLIARKVF